MSIAMNGQTANAFDARMSSAEPSPRLKHEGVTDKERNFSIFMHLSPIIGVAVWPFYFAPLVLWLMRKDESVFNDDHGREVLSFMVSFILINIILVCTIIGAVLIPVVWIVALVSIIRGAVAAGNGEYFRYPLTWRFFA